MFPVYDRTFGRSKESRLTFPDQTSAYREWMINLVNDARRTVDYLVTRSDIQRDNLGYVGFSWGGQMGPLILALEPRFKAAVFIVGGLWSGKQLPEVDPFNFAPRVLVPVLMLNGIEDAIFPLETSQEPLFDMLGTGVKVHKKIAAGHSLRITHRSLVTSETIDWLNTHLGPVN